MFQDLKKRRHYGVKQCHNIPPSSIGKKLFCPKMTQIQIAFYVCPSERLGHPFANVGQLQGSPLFLAWLRVLSTYFNLSNQKNWSRYNQNLLCLAFQFSVDGRTCLNRMLQVNVATNDVKERQMMICFFFLLIFIEVQLT